MNEKTERRLTFSHRSTPRLCGYYSHAVPPVTFTINFLAAIPWVGLLAYGSDQLIQHLGTFTGALVSNTLANAAQLITSVALIRKLDIILVKENLMGTILTTLLLVTGCSFLLGGIGRAHQTFDVDAVRTSTALAIFGTICITVPTAFTLFAESPNEVPDLVDTDVLSRATAALSITLYTGVLIFEHRTLPFINSRKASGRPADSSSSSSIAHQVAAGAAARAIRRLRKFLDRKESYKRPDGSRLRISRTLSASILLVSIILLGFHLEFATDSLQGMARRTSQSFISVVLLPLLSTDPSPVLAAIEDDMDLTMATTLSKSVQTQALVVPLLVLIETAMGIENFNYTFDAQWVVALIGSVLVLSYITSQGRTSW